MKMPRGCCSLATVCLVAMPAVARDATPAEARPVEESARVTAELANRVIGGVIPQVEQLRQLEFLESVPVDVIDDATARKHVLDRAERFDLQEQVANSETAFRLLGLIGADDDLLELFLGALDEQAGGFYDPAEKRFYLLDDMPASAIEVLTAHELTHALEDQHYDLDRRLLEVIEDDDRLFARSAVHEGSATLVMTVFAARAMLAGKLDPVSLQRYEEEFGQGQALAALPPVLLRQMLGPYVLGAWFLARGDTMRVMQHGIPVADVNRTYADPPTSSEQILHPEKYWNERDDPVALDMTGVGSSLGKRWKQAGAGTLGELSLAVLVGADTPDDPMVLMTKGAAAWTHPAADGWDGDRWELWERGESAVILLLTAWDSEADAEEFERALDGKRGLRARRAGDRVAVVAGEAGRRLDRLFDALLDPARAGSPPP